MTRPIRAYLTWRNGDDWSVNVCRDLESVVDAWARAVAAGEAAILHIGFDRPPSTIFEDLLKANPARLLLTGSARYGLPIEFGATSEPIGYASGLPVYLGTRGWGYQIEEGAIPRQEEPVPRQEFRQDQILEGWVAAFLVNYADLLPEFQKVGVFNEASFLRSENQLPLEARRLAAQFRLRSLIGEADDDPCAIARAAPPWLSEREFTTLLLPTRASNVFINLGIKRVSDLAGWSSTELMRVPNFGRKSLREVGQVLMAAFAEGPFDIGSKIARAGAQSLRSEIQRTLGTLGYRERAVLSRRMGFDRPSDTLQSISEDYGVTRERIRQIEAKVIKRVIREAFWDDLLKSKLDELLAGRDFPLPLIGVEALDPWFSGIADHPGAVRYLLANFCDGQVDLVNIDGVDYFGFITQQAWDAALTEAQRILAFSAGKGWTEKQCRDAIDPLVGERAREFRSILWNKALAQCHFGEGPTGERVLISYGRGAEQLVEAILVDAGRPLHYAEIAKIAVEEYSRPLDIRTAHNAAAAVGVLVGRGKYSAVEALGFSSEEADHLVDMAEDMVLAGSPDRQWHASEIYSALLETEVLPEHLDKYSLDFLLRRSGRLRRLGRMAWAQEIESAPDERIELREVIVALLEEAGRPLSTNEIRQRVVARRGVNGLFQLQVGDPLIRIGSALWGLNDRDVSVKRSQQAELFSNLFDLLNSNGAGIHLSEIENMLGYLPSGTTATSVFLLSALDPRFGVNSGQYLYLRSWNEARRESVTEALRGVMEEAHRPLTIEAIHSAVSARLRRSTERGQISAGLQDSDYLYEPTSHTWTLAVECDRDDDDGDDAA